MKKSNTMMYFLVVCLISVTLFGCSHVESNEQQFQDSKKISIVTTIYPLYDFAINIAGDKAEIINLIPAGIEPHAFELTTGNMKLIEQADILVYNGANMEGFMDKTLSATSNKDLMIVEASANIEVNKVDGTVDPHTWLSIKNAMLEAEQIKEVLVGFDPKNAKYYEDNYNAYKKKLEKLDKKFQSELTNKKKDAIIVSHEAFGYLCKDYDIKQVAIEGLNAESEPNSARMKEIIDFCKENQVDVIFYEKLASPKVVESIASEVGAKTMVLNPIGGRTKEQEEAGMDYIKLMEENLESLKQAIK